VESPDSSANLSKALGDVTRGESHDGQACQHTGESGYESPPAAPIVTREGLIPLPALTGTSP